MEGVVVLSGRCAHFITNNKNGCLGSRFVFAFASCLQL